MKAGLLVACAVCACNAGHSSSTVPSAAPSSSSPARAPLAREHCRERNCEPEVVARNQKQIYALTLAGGRPIWGTYDLNARSGNAIRTLEAPRGEPRDILGGLELVCGLAVADGYLYYGLRGFTFREQLRRMPLAGGKPELIAQTPWACKFALLPREIVISSRTELNAIPRTGGPARVLGKATPNSEIWTHGEDVYWSSDQGVWRNHRGSVERVLSEAPVYAMAITDDYLVVRRGGKQPGILRARHDGTDVRLLYGGDVDALAADARHAYIACGDRGKSVIRRIALSDGEMALLARRRRELSTQLALDETYVYFTDASEGVVLRVHK